MTEPVPSRRPQTAEADVLRALAEIAGSGSRSPDDLAGSIVRAVSALFDGAPTTVRWVDPQSGLLEELNSVGGTAAGQASEEVIGVGLELGGRELGRLQVRIAGPSPIRADRQEVLDLIAPVLASMLDAAARAVDSRLHSGVHRALYDVAVAAGGILNAAELGQLVIDRAEAIAGSGIAGLTLVDPVTGNLKPLVDNDPNWDLRDVLAAGKGAVGIAFATGRPVVVPDYQRWDLAISRSAASGIQSGAAIPLVVGDRPIGVLALRSYVPTHLSAEQVDALTLLAALVGPAIEAARLYQESQYQAGLFQTLHETAVAAGGLLEPAALCHLVVDRARENLDPRAGVSLYWWDSGADELRLLATNDRRDDQLLPLRAGEGVIGACFEQRESAIVNDYNAHPGGLERGRQRGLRSLAAVPLLVGDRAVGVLSMCSYDEDLRFGEQAVKLASLLALQVAPAIEAARLHEGLRATEGSIREIYQSLACAVLVQDREGRITDANRQAADLLGVSRSALLAGDRQVLGAIRYEDEAGRTLNETPPTMVRRTGIAAREQIVRIVRADQTVVWTQIDCVPLFDGDRALIRTVTSCIDITGMRRAEDARKESEAKSRFLATMSHELRTPLNSVLGYAQLLEMNSADHLTDRDRRYLEHIISSGRHLLSLIDEVLDLARVGSGQMKLSMEAVELAQLVEAAIAHVRPMAEAARIELAAEVGAGQVWADRGRLHQILLNLLSNAIKFSAGGQVVVRAWWEGERVRIVVRDSGEGIPAHELKRVFEEFTQVESGMNRSHQGTGLGLPLSRRLAELMGGTLELESEEGAGTSVTVVLAAVAAIEPETEG